MLFEPIDIMSRGRGKIKAVSHTNRRCTKTYSNAHTQTHTICGRLKRSVTVGELASRSLSQCLHTHTLTHAHKGCAPLRLCNKLLLRRKPHIKYKKGAANVAIFHKHTDKHICKITHGTDPAIKTPTLSVGKQAAGTKDLNVQNIAPPNTQAHTHTPTHRHTRLDTHKSIHPSARKCTHRFLDLLFLRGRAGA